MRLVSSVMLTSALFALASCAATPQTGEAALTASSVDGKEVECRRVTTTESRLGQRVGNTKEQWAAIEKAEKEAADNLRDRTSDQVRDTTPPSGFGG